MKFYQALLPIAAAMMIAGCGNRGTAQNVVGQSDGILNKLRPEASVTAPNELKAADATLAHMKQNFEAREYKVVVADVPQFNAQVKALEDAMAKGQNVQAQAMQDWSTLNTEVPKSIEAIQARVDSLKPAALPKDVTKEELATAKTELETMKTTWTEASTAAESGDLTMATEKGRTVQAKAEELKNSLGMNEQLASVAQPPAGTTEAQ
jgi:predicted  nucleic acid-binding Zn-ribbon protein